MSLSLPLELINPTVSEQFPGLDSLSLFDARIWAHKVDGARHDGHQRSINDDDEDNAS